MGLKNIVKGISKSKKKYFLHLNSFEKYCVNNFVKNNESISPRYTNKNKTLKIIRGTLILNYIKLRTLKMSNVFFKFYKRRYEKSRKKKKKKYLFEIKNMVRKYGYITHLKYNKVNEILLKKRKQLIIFNMINQIDDYSIDLDGYSILIYLINSKKLNFSFDTLKTEEFFSLYFDKYLNIQSYKYKESFNNYIYNKKKLKYYEYRFIKYKFISKKYTISLIKKKTPQSFDLFNKKKKTNKYSINFIVFFLCSFYIKHHIKVKKSNVFIFLKKNLYKLILFYLRKFYSYIFIFFKNNFLHSNKSSSMFFFKNEYMFSLVLLNFHKIYANLKLYFWKFHGVHQLESMYVYLGFYFFKEFDFLEKYLNIFIINQIFKDYLGKRILFTYYFRHKCVKESFSNWIFGKKRNIFKNTGQIKNKKENIILVLKKKQTFEFFIFYIINIYNFVIKGYKKDMFISLKIRNFFIKIRTIKHIFYLYPFYRRNVFYYGFYYMFRRKYKGPVYFKKIENKPRIYKIRNVNLIRKPK